MAFFNMRALSGRGLNSLAVKGLFYVNVEGIPVFWRVNAKATFPPNHVTESKTNIVCTRIDLTLVAEVIVSMQSL